MCYSFACLDSLQPIVGTPNPPFPCPPRLPNARCSSSLPLIPPHPLFSVSYELFAQTTHLRIAATLFFSAACALLRKQWGVAHPPSSRIPLPPLLNCPSTSRRIGPAGRRRPIS